MAMKFYGTLSALAEFLRRQGIYGSWNEEPNSVHMLRTDLGVNVHWASTKKTLWCTGRQPHHGRITKKLQTALVIYQAEIEDPDDDDPDEDFELDEFDPNDVM